VDVFQESDVSGERASPLDDAVLVLYETSGFGSILNAPAYWIFPIGGMVWTEITWRAAIKE